MKDSTLYSHPLAGKNRTRRVQEDSVIFWLVVLLFILAQNIQVGLYGWAFRRVGGDEGTAERVAAAFREPVFLASLVLLSIATAACRLWLFPTAGVARTHVITSAAVVLSFAVFALIFGEDQRPSQYFGAALCAFGIFLVAR
jgi:drug/metabolite transporter (DMT)-like permease